MIVVLNGTSSAGKTTLAKALQDTLPTPYLVLGIDTVVFALPRRYLNSPLWTEQVFRYGYDGDRIVSIEPAEYGDRLVHSLHEAIAAVARSGQDVIVDHVLLSRAWADDLTTSLAGLDVLRVGVLCPLQTVEARETSRGDRTLGQARAQYDVVHKHLPYDLTVDTAHAGATELATTIAKALR